MLRPLSSTARNPAIAALRGGRHTRIGRASQRVAVERDALALGPRVDATDRCVADAPLRDVQHPLDAHFVSGVRDRTQVADRILDLTPVVEPVPPSTL